MLSGGSRSYIRGSGGVDTFRGVVVPNVDDGTTLPEIDRPLAPNGTGGFRIPNIQTIQKKKEKKRDSISKIKGSLILARHTHATQSWYSITDNLTGIFQFPLTFNFILISRNGHIFCFGT